MLTGRDADALQLAWRLHDGQLRKGTAIPYVSHLMLVQVFASHGRTRLVDELDRTVTEIEALAGAA